MLAQLRANFFDTRRAFMKLFQFFISHRRNPLLDRGGALVSLVRFSVRAHRLVSVSLLTSVTST
eukprot:3818156-Pleurochrysis_carterae.AAC.1